MAPGIQHNAPRLTGKSQQESFSAQHCAAAGSCGSIPARIRGTSAPSTVARRASARRAAPRHPCSRWPTLPAAGRALPHGAYGRSSCARWTYAPLQALQPEAARRRRREDRLGGPRALGLQPPTCRAPTRSPLRRRPTGAAEYHLGDESDALDDWSRRGRPGPRTLTVQLHPSATGRRLLQEGPVRRAAPPAESQVLGPGNSLSLGMVSQSAKCHISAWRQPRSCNTFFYGASTHHRAAGATNLQHYGGARVAATPPTTLDHRASQITCGALTMLYVYCCFVSAYYFNCHTFDYSPCNEYGAAGPVHRSHQASRHLSEDEQLRPRVPRSPTKIIITTTPYLLGSTTSLFHPQHLPANHQLLHHSRSCC